jgi:uncharacterized Zn-binding protein involved in type VI secretion
MSGTNVERAAHVDHTIEHSHKDLGNFIGLGLGILAGIAIVATGGLAAAPLACGIAVLGGDIGTFVGGVFPNRADSGHIALGSPTVFYGPETKPAARMNDRTACYSPGMPTMERLSPWLAIVNPVFAGMSLLSAARGLNRAIVINFEMEGIPVLPSDSEPGAHAGSRIADGSETVFIETWPAARDKDGVHPCDGKISSGIDSILIGGPQCRMRGTEERSEIDRGQRFVSKTISIAGNILKAMRGDIGAIVSLIGEAGSWYDERITAVTGIFGTLRGITQFGVVDPNKPPDPLQWLRDANSGVGIARGTMEKLPGQLSTLQGPRPAPNSFDPTTRTVGPPVYPRRRLSEWGFGQ